eukprot:m.180748 g.180748  ORF g.180748 m.180748 type:complete len:308 (+) comp16863_c0_seq3:113-1036(+)
MTWARVKRTLRHYAFRTHAVSADDISGTLETIAVVAALTIASILSLALAAGEDEFLAADAFVRPGYNLSSIDSFEEAISLNLPSARVLNWAYTCLGLSTTIFGVCIMLIVSASESGFRPSVARETDDHARLDEMLRLLHVSNWYKKFRLLLFGLMAILVVALALLYLTSLDFVNVKYPKYGRPSKTFTAWKENSTYAAYVKDANFSRWVLVLVGVYILVQHMRTYADALDNHYLLGLEEVKQQVVLIQQQMNQQRDADRYASRHPYHAGQVHPEENGNPHSSDPASKQAFNQSSEIDLAPLVGDTPC